MIKFMVDLRTSADAAAVAGIVELREVVAKLGADLDEVTGSVSSESGAGAAIAGRGRLSPAVATAVAADSESSENAPAPKATARPARKKAGE